MTASVDAPPAPESAVPVDASENVRSVYEGYEEFNGTGEIPVERFHPEVEFLQFDGFAGTGTNKGVEGVRKVLADVVANFESLKMRPREVVAERGDDMLIRVAVTALAKGSNIQVKETMFHLWTRRDDKLTRWFAFAEEEPAREAFAGGRPGE